MIEHTNLLEQNGIDSGENDDQKKVQYNYYVCLEGERGGDDDDDDDANIHFSRNSENFKIEENSQKKRLPCILYMNFFPNVRSQ